MNFYTHLLGSSSLNKEIPFFRIVRLTDSDVVALSESDISLSYILTNQSKGFAKVLATSTKKDELTGYNKFQIEWEYTYDIDQATRFVTSEAARYFAKIYCCGVTASYGWSWFHEDHARTVRFLECLQNEV